jgi:hypothetical protein
MDETFVIHGEWWWIAAVLRRASHDNLPRFEAVGVRDRNSRGYTATFVSDALGEIGTVVLSGDDRRTTLRVTAPDEYAEHWRGLVSTIRAFADEARETRQHFQGLTAEEVIEQYYRMKGQRSRITLNELAKRHGFNASYLRTVKSEYDRKRGRGKES